jgi:hypothetical protein
MDILKKIETLLNATTRSRLPRRKRHSALDEQEEKLLAEIRQAVANVQAQERVLAERLKAERVQVQEAARRGNRADQRAHEKRAGELERQLEQESIQAINLEEKLAALEEKLALAKEAVEKQAQEAATRDTEAEKVLAKGGRKGDTRMEAILKSPTEEVTSNNFDDDEPDVAARKSRLGD